MNELQKIRLTAGQKTHERFYGSTIIYRNQEVPITNSSFKKDPMLVIGGLSPNSEQWVTFRRDMLPQVNGQPKEPAKDEFLDLRFRDDDSGVIQLKVSFVEYPPGDLLIKLFCVDRNQGA